MSTTAAARVMARGRHIELRLWERDPAGERAFEPDEAHEHANYVQAGALIVPIGDDPPLEVHAGDSYVVPAGWAARSRCSSRPSWSRRSARLTARTDFRSVYLRTWLTQRPVGVVGPTCLSRPSPPPPHSTRSTRGCSSRIPRPRWSTPTAPPASCWAWIATSCAAAPSCRRPASACRSRARRFPSAGRAPTRCARAVRSARASWASRAPTAACAGCACPRGPSAARC